MIYPTPKYYANFWMQAYNAQKQHHHVSEGMAAKSADEALEEFKKRFSGEGNEKA